MPEQILENVLPTVSIRNSDLTILVADDSRTLRMMVEGKLKEQGYGKILTAEDGASALSLLKSENIDCLLCDWDMPGTNGFQLLTALRKDEAISNVPFILVTAKATKMDILNAIRAGVDDYVVKPIQFPVLLRKITEVIVRRAHKKGS